MESHEVADVDFKDSYALVKVRRFTWHLGRDKKQFLKRQGFLFHNAVNFW